ncbi:MAG: hypothetical protein H6747_02720 [Deltaproteobacteria bacterium]|nr:hypothetical protein [Deltaproteobacteria bacterium]
MACSSEPAAPSLRWVGGRPDLRLGSSVEVLGAVASGQKLSLRAVGGALTVAGIIDPARGTWRGAVTQVDAALPAGVALTSLCAEPAPEFGITEARCAPLTGIRFSPLPALGPAVIGSEAATAALGRRVGVQATGLPAPGEGLVWLDLRAEVAGLAYEATAAVAVDGATATFAIPDFGVALPQTMQVRARMMRQLPAGGVEIGPFGSPATWALEPPVLLGEGGGFAAGRELDLALDGGFAPGAASVRLAGTWRRGEVIVATWTDDVALALPLHGDGVRSSAYLPAALDVSAALAALQPGDRFIGEARFVGKGWLGPTHPITLLRGARVQHLVVRFDPSAAIGLWRLGVTAAASRLEARVLALVESHFDGFAVQVHGAWQPGVVEAVEVRVHGDDPNGMGLLGTEPSPGKDVGNHVLDEQIGAFCPAAWEAGVPAWGGVFLASFLRFSPTLFPSGGSVDARFDAIFGPFAAELGGVPAVGDGPVLDAAVEALAQLVAGTVSHEVGHALGLAAGTADWHHPGDSPGWRMDRGTARPFAERAALAGAISERWGVVDEQYLQQVLPHAGVAP